MEKPKLIILMGLPGAGKSYWANYIEKKYKARVLSGEEIAIKIFGTSKCKAKEYKLVYKKIRQQAKRLLKDGLTVIIDGTNLRYQYRKEIYKEVSWPETILIYFLIDDETALERLKKRGGCDKKTFYEFKRQLEESLESEKVFAKIIKLSQDQQKIKTTLENLLS